MMRFNLFLFLTSALISCKKEINNYIDTENKIDIFGSIGPSIKYKNKYYCFFRNDNDNLNTLFTSTFYIIDESGKTESKIEVPNELQTFYYDLYVKNDSIFVTEYNDNETYFLNFDSKTFEKTKKGIDLFYKDADFEVYSLDFGEWGSTIWFKDLKTNLQYQMHGHAPIVNKIKDIYYVTTENTVYEIKDPKKLLKSEKYYNLKNLIKDKYFYKEGSFSTTGTKTLIEFDYDEFSDDNIQILTSFVSNDSLFHIYKDSISIKVGFIENQNFIQTREFSKDIKPLQFHYDWRMPFYENQQTIPFITNNEKEFGFLEINNGKIETTIFSNQNAVAKLSYNDMLYWFKTSFNRYFVNFNSLNLEEVDEIEKHIKAENLTQNHKIDHYLLDGLDKTQIETPRIYRKFELPNQTFLTSYYYNKKSKNIFLIEFEWKNDNSKLSFEDRNESRNKIDLTNQKRFEDLSHFFNTYLEKKSIDKKTDYRHSKTWIKDNKIIELTITDYEIVVTLRKK